MPDLPAPIRAFVSDLANSGFSVWLIGSQANGTSNEASDWDLLVFGNERLLECLAVQEPIENIDLLVVYDGDAFCSPWNQTMEGFTKWGSLSGWKWREVSDAEATYSGTKWPHDWGSPKQAKKLAP
jgi:hypothetical protein